jgi:polyhydroxyalkanoate synthase
MSNSNGKHNGVDIRSESPLETLASGQQGDRSLWCDHLAAGGADRLADAPAGAVAGGQCLVRRPAGLAIARHAPGAGHPSADVIQPHADDARFADPVWTESATWDIVKEWYIAFTHRLEDMFFETPGLSDKERRRSAFWLRNWLNMVAPTNFSGSTRWPCAALSKPMAKACGRAGNTSSVT